MFKNVDYIMVNTSDMKRSIEFYRDRIGFKLKFESPEWTEFDTGTTTLALHGGAVPKTASGVPSEKQTAGTCTFGFTVENVQKTYEALKERGVRFVLEPTQRPNENIKLAIALDPDGLGISFAEMHE